MQVRLSWAPYQDAPFVVLGIEKSTDGGPFLTLVQQINPSQTMTTDISVQEGQTIIYRMYAHNNRDTLRSDYCVAAPVVVTGTPPVGQQRPPAPQGLQAVVLP